MQCPHRDGCQWQMSRWRVQNHGFSGWLFDRSARSRRSASLMSSLHVEATDGVVGFPAPGHTRGSVLWHVDGHLLFSGDSLAWSSRSDRLTAFWSACWYSCTRRWSTSWPGCHPVAEEPHVPHHTGPPLPCRTGPRLLPSSRRGTPGSEPGHHVPPTSRARVRVESALRAHGDLDRQPRGPCGGLDGIRKVHMEMMSARGAV